MGCCTSSHLTAEDLEVTFNIGNQASNFSEAAHDSFSDVSLSSHSKCPSGEKDDSPEPVFFVHSGTQSFSSHTLDLFLRRNERSLTMTQSAQEPMARFSHIRATSWVNGSETQGERSGLSTNYSGKGSLIDRALISK